MNKKLLIVSVALALVACFAVGMTVAYLTSTPDPVINTFTVGNVTITLDELDVTTLGVAETPETRVPANDYMLIPGHQYIKDPTIHVQAGSEDCICIVRIEIPEALGVVIDQDDLDAQLTAKGWVEFTDHPGYYYNTAIKSAEQDLVVFEHIKVLGTATNAQLAAIPTTTPDNQIKITAYAVQAEGIVTEGSTVTAAYAGTAYTAVVGS